MLHTENGLHGHTSGFEGKSLSGMQQTEVEEQGTSNPQGTASDWALTGPPPPPEVAGEAPEEESF